MLKRTGITFFQELREDREGEILFDYAVEQQSDEKSYQGHYAAQLNSQKMKTGDTAVDLLLMTPTSVFSPVTEGEEASDNENIARLPER